MQGRTLNQLRGYIDGTSTVKKCNAIGHLAKGSAHDADVLALTDDLPAELEDLFEKGAAVSNSTTALLTIQTMLLSLNAVNRQQLLKKQFQLAHFIEVQVLFNSLYQHIAKFEKEIRGVNLRWRLSYTSYLYRN